MNPLLQCKSTILPLFIAGVLACFGLLPKAPAVVPPPDGGYPGFNTAEGQNALFSLTTGTVNTAVGWSSLFSNAVGSFNTATGGGSLLFNTGENNSAFGGAVLLNNTFGSNNTAVGTTALLSNTEGNGNTAIGVNALLNNRTGSFNTALGFQAGKEVITANDVICIGLDGANVSGTTWIRNIFGVTTESGTTAPVIVSDGGQLGTATSSKRFKKDIASMEKASEVILSLRPVTFHYKTDTKGTPQFGLIAEEVAEVNPALVLPDKEGKPYTVRYDAVNAMLLNEFLKEHQKNEEQQAAIAEQKATITELKCGMQALTATVKEQAAQIQKVSAQLEVGKPAPQVVNNP